MDGDVGANDSGDVQCRSRSYSIGTIPMSQGNKMAGSKRIRARLEASTVGLDELLLLKQTQHRAIESVKAMFMSNVPLEERMETEKLFKVTINVPSPIVEKVAPKSNKVKGNVLGSSMASNKSQLEDSGYGEGLHPQEDSSQIKRSLSMDVSVARALALTAKKLARARSKEMLHQHTTTKLLQPEGRPSGGRRRTRSYNDPACNTPDTQGLTKEGDRDKHSHKDSRNGPNHRMLKNSPSRREGGMLLQPNKHNDLSTEKSLSGSFLSIESSPKSFPSSPENLNKHMNESMFDGHFKSPRSLSNSKLIFEFPSPMHAILLHFDKTKEPVLNSNKLDDASRSPIAKISQFSPLSCALERKISHRSNSLSKYKLRKDSSLGDSAIDFSDIHSMQTDKSVKQKELFVDDGVTAFIEMLANRGLAKRKREGIENERLWSRPDNGDVFLQDKQSDSLYHNAKCESDKINASDSSISGSSLKLSDDYIGSLDGSGLSSSGKRGSRVSVRSSTSSKASLSSEEGYYSHPGSPKNRREHEKFDNQTSISAPSLVITNVDSDNTEVAEEILSADGSNSELNASHKSETEIGTIEIISLPDSPGARRRKPKLNQDLAKSVVSLMATSSESLAIPHDKSMHHSRSLPNSPRKVPRGITQFDFGPILNNPSPELHSSCGRTETTSETSEKSQFSVVKPLHNTQQKSSGQNKQVGDLGLPLAETKNSTKTWAEAVPNGNNIHSTPKNGLLHDSPTNVFQRLHCYESPRTPTIKEEPRKEALERNDSKSRPLSLKLDIPTDHDEGELRSPPICQAPKVPSWRRKSKGMEGQQVSKSGEQGKLPLQIESEKNEDVRPKREKVRRSITVDSSSSTLERSSKKENTPPMEVVSPRGKHFPSQVQTTPRLKVSPPTPSQITPKGRPVVGPQLTVSRTKKSPETSEKNGGGNIFKYPARDSKNCPVPPTTPTRKDIPEILKNWVESKTPTLTHDQNPKQVRHSKSFSLPVPMGPQPLTPTLSPRPNTQVLEMTLGKSKRYFRSQEVLPNEKCSEERLSMTIDRRSPCTPNKGAVHIRFRKYNTDKESSPQPLKANKDIVNMKKDSDDTSVPKVSAVNSQNMNETHSRGRSASWSKGHSPPASSKNAWVREIVVPCTPQTNKIGTTRPRSASFNLNTNKSANLYRTKSQMMWYQGKTEVNDTFV